MKTFGLQIAANLHVAGMTFMDRAKAAFNDQDRERGSITLEQLLWGAGIGIAAVAGIAIFVAKITEKSGTVGGL